LKLKRDGRNTYRILARKGLLGTTKMRWKDNFKMDLTAVGCEDERHGAFSGLSPMTNFGISRLSILVLLPKD
jgi:hypothetical protein